MIFSRAWDDDQSLDTELCFIVMIDSTHSVSSGITVFRFIVSFFRYTFFR